MMPRNVRLSGASFPALAPMWWDDMEGAYMVVLVVGAGVVELVLDTGSSQLSVKGAGCEWRNCTPLGCAITSCPCGFQENGDPRSDCSEHYYQPTGPRLAPGEKGAGVSTTMTYGSQTDTIQHYLDTVHVPVSADALTCAQIMRAPAPDELSRVNTDKVRVGELVVHRVSHIEGASSSNLLGLARPDGGSVEHGRRVVLDDMLDRARVWSVVLRPRGGWFALGKLPCFAPPRYMPLLQPPAFRGFLTSFYIVGVVSMSVGPSLDRLTKLRDTPKYCVVDTGTTSTYMSVRGGAALDAAGYVENSSVMRLVLGAPGSPVTLDYASDHLRDPDYPSQGVIEAWEGRTLSDWDQIFPESMGGVLLLGAIMMQDMMWEFDLGKKRIGVVTI